MCGFLFGLGLGCQSTNQQRDQSPAPEPGARICGDRPDDVQGSNCVPRELAERQSTGCTPEGKQRSGKTFDPPCCAGLSEISLNLASRDANCQPAPDANVCAACGNGVCGPGEDACSCPIDCEGR